MTEPGCWRVHHDRSVASTGLYSGLQRDRPEVRPKIRTRHSAKEASASGAVHSTFFSLEPP
jgi:hypothetical protein